MSRYQVTRADSCINCGLCESLCPYGVHRRVEGHVKIMPPAEPKCIGPSCSANSFYCVKNCPTQSLSVEPEPGVREHGRPALDPGHDHWPPGSMAETGEPLPLDHTPSMPTPAAASTACRSQFPPLKGNFHPEEISTAIDLNHRKYGTAVKIDIPVYGGGMSFGSVSKRTMLAKAMAATEWNTFTCTGEGGYPDMLMPYKDHVITQIATGLFGVREETIKRAPIVEFKYAQGAKPGLGGHLLYEKNTPEVAKMREAVPYTSLFSPFPFHASTRSRTTRSISTGSTR